MSKFKKISLSVLIVSMLVVVSVILSKLFSIGLIPTATNQKGRINLDAVYFVSVDSFASETDAQSLATEISQVGGAGYVYKKDKFYVITSFYLTEKDANSVCANLKINYENATSLKVEFKQINLEASEFVQSVSECLKTLLEFYINSSIKLDKGETTENAILISSLSVHSQIEACINLLETSVKDGNIKCVTLLKTLKSNLNLINVNSNFSQMLKYIGINSANEIAQTFSNF